MNAWTAHAPEWLTIALLVGAFLFTRHFGGGAALSELELANKVLVKSVAELRADNVRLTAEVSALRASRDVGLAIMPVLEALRLHETQATERSAATVNLLSLIADRLGPEAQAA